MTNKEEAWYGQTLFNINFALECIPIIIYFHTWLQVKNKFLYKPVEVGYFEAELPSSNYHIIIISLCFEIFSPCGYFLGGHE